MPKNHSQMLEDKLSRLSEWLRGAGRVAIALSGGMDSACLLREAVRTLGVDNVLALTLKSDLLSAGELARSRAVAKALSVKQVLVPVDVFAHEDVVRNGTMRCYHCKSAMLAALKSAAEERGFGVVVDGTQSDDMQAARPGRRALQELNIPSPLAIAGLGKAEIRQLCADWPEVDNPPNACLATRIPFGTPLNKGDLARVERAERAVALPGVRVRCHGDLARIELHPSQWDALLEPKKLQRTLTRIKAVGFAYVALDLEGYRVSGSEDTDEKG